MSLEQIGKILVATAVVIGLAGVVVFILGRGLGVARLPGDLLIRRDEFTCLIPVATMILVSVILTVLVNLIFWLLRRF